MLIIVFLVPPNPSTLSITVVEKEKEKYHEKVRVKNQLTY